MYPTIDLPYYQKGANETNDASFQISQLIRSGSDARRLLTPIQDWAVLSDRDDDGEELESILQQWGDPSFVAQADRALTVLEELDELWTDRGGVDMMDLGERRVLINALSTAIFERQQQLREQKPR